MRRTMSALAAAIAAFSVGAATAQIVGGQDARIEDHPWMTALAVGPDGARQLCGAALVSEHWAVTAAHCFEAARDPRLARAVSGEDALDPAALWAEIDLVSIAPDYDPASFDSDIAMVRLREPAPGAPIAIAADDPDAWTPLVAAGWGAVEEGGGFSAILQEATVPLVEREECATAYPGRISDNMLCAGLRQGGVDACQGDSGGPLVHRGPEGPELVGIVSWGEGCGRPGRYGVYTRASRYRDWIAAHVALDRAPDP